LQNFIDSFLDEFFKTIDRTDDNLNLYSRFIHEFEKPLIINTLKYCKGNQIKTARLLGINRNTLRAKISKLKISNKLGKE
jgi:two-component system nitrogen regulation response regulator GlnG